jgi:hypothetical protein
MQSVILTRMSVIVTLTSVIMKCEVSVSNQHSAWHCNRTRLRVASMLKIQKEQKDKYTVNLF